MAPLAMQVSCGCAAWVALTAADAWSQHSLLWPDIALLVAQSLALFIFKDYLTALKQRQGLFRSIAFGSMLASAILSLLLRKQRQRQALRIEFSSDPSDEFGWSSFAQNESSIQEGALFLSEDGDFDPWEQLQSLSKSLQGLKRGLTLLFSLGLQLSFNWQNEVPQPQQEGIQSAERGSSTASIETPNAQRESSRPTVNGSLLGFQRQKLLQRKVAPPTEVVEDGADSTVHEAASSHPSLDSNGNMETTDEEITHMEEPPSPGAASLFGMQQVAPRKKVVLGQLGDKEGGGRSSLNSLAGQRAPKTDAVLNSGTAITKNSDSLSLSYAAGSVLGLQQGITLSKVLLQEEDVGDDDNSANDRISDRLLSQPNVVNDRQDASLLGLQRGFSLKKVLLKEVEDDDAPHEADKGGLHEQRRTVSPSHALASKTTSQEVGDSQSMIDEQDDDMAASVLGLQRFVKLGRFTVSRNEAQTMQNPHVIRKKVVKMTDGGNTWFSEEVETEFIPQDGAGVLGFQLGTSMSRTTLQEDGPESSAPNELLSQADMGHAPSLQKQMKKTQATELVEDVEGGISQEPSPLSGVQLPAPDEIRQPWLQQSGGTRTKVILEEEPDDKVKQEPAPFSGVQLPTPDEIREPWLQQSGGTRTKDLLEEEPDDTVTQEPVPLSGVQLPTSDEIREPWLQQSGGTRTKVLLEEEPDDTVKQEPVPLSGVQLPTLDEIRQPWLQQSAGTRTKVLLEEEPDDKVKQEPAPLSGVQLPKLDEARQPWLQQSRGTRTKVLLEEEPEDNEQDGSKLASNPQTTPAMPQAPAPSKPSLAANLISALGLQRGMTLLRVPQRPLGGAVA